MTKTKTSEAKTARAQPLAPHDLLDLAFLCHVAAGSYLGAANVALAELRPGLMREHDKARQFAARLGALALAA